MSTHVFGPSAVLVVDIETASEADITIGAWAYSQHPSTIVYCVVFKLCDGKDGARLRQEWEPGESEDALHSKIRHHIITGKPVVAHNVIFEWSIWKNILQPLHGFPDVLDGQWLDTQARAVALNLPFTLDGVGAALGCKVQKDKDGAKLMRKMAKATRDEHGNLVYDRDPVHLELLIAYCSVDVDATDDIFYALPPMHPFEALTWQCDQEINRRGAYLHQGFAAQCMEIARQRGNWLADHVFALTGGELAGTSSVPALKVWVEGHGVKLPQFVRRNVKGEAKKSTSLDKAAIGTILADPETLPIVRQVLEARAEAGKLTSLAKLRRVPVMVGSDGRLRGAFRYNGAHTGRWSSSGVQLHNLPKCKLSPEDADAVMMCVEAGDLDMLMLFAEQPLAAMSQLLRSIVQAAPGNDLIAADFAGIEARVIAWLAGQHDILALFEEDRDVYVYAAAQVGSKSRQLGKVLTLALGYGMGDVKFHATAAQWGVSLTLKEARAFKKLWRDANTEIVSFWYALESAAMSAVANPGEMQRLGKLSLISNEASLRVILPSGRSAYYHRPHVRFAKKRIQIVNENGEIETREIEGNELRFYTVGRDKSSMVVEGTYAGKLAENLTQAVARDLLAAALHRLRGTEYKVVVHVHDSVAAEVPEGTGDLAEFERITAESPDWAAGLPIAVEGYRGKRFRG